ncbi:MAG: hypothetical protein BWZ10_03513 [candidate division BRC1 bacterium ADurb.BinA364]|nr:MAG: hypothetical protein BWZ10_03513 [candidate division BRC1 bacterium ADurb.BinA364]
MAEDALDVGFVFREEKRGNRIARSAVETQDEAAQRFVLGRDRGVARALEPGLEPAAFVAAAPGPGVAEPERRQDMNRRARIGAVGDFDADQNVVGRILGVFDEDIEIAPAVERPCVVDLELRLAQAAPGVFLDQSGVREFGLGIFVERFEVGMRRSGIEIIIALLDILAVVALRAGQAEKPLLEDRIAFVPQRQREAEPAFAVADAEQPILAPAIGAAARIVKGKVAPGVALRRIVLANRSPLALGQIRPPALPVFFPLLVLAQPLAFGVFAALCAHRPSPP